MKFGFKLSGAPCPHRVMAHAADIHRLSLFFDRLWQGHSVVVPTRLSLHKRELKPPYP